MAIFEVERHRATSAMQELIIVSLLAPDHGYQIFQAHVNAIMACSKNVC